MYHWYAENYPELKGCTAVALYSERFTKARFLDYAHQVLGGKGVKKCGIFFSSHGTTIPRGNENHAAIVCSDSNWNNEEDTFLFDTDLKEYLFDAFPNTRFYMTADACESGPLGFKLLDQQRGVNKFIAPPPDIALMIAHNAGGIHRSIGECQTPNLAYVSGTGGPGKYSIDEGDGGAFTKKWIEVVKPAMSTVVIAGTLDHCMDAHQQPQAHGGLAGDPWFS
jgi:hypothetical protein